MSDNRDTDAEPTEIEKQEAIRRTHKCAVCILQTMCIVNRAIGGTSVIVSECEMFLELPDELKGIVT